MKVRRLGESRVIETCNHENKRDNSFWQFLRKDKNTRHLFQLAFLLVTLSTGLRFFIYVFHAGGNGAISVSRPAGVEGFLPIGALISWKRFFLTGVWDTVHPAAMVIFGFAIVISFIAHKAFCSWLCPVGAVSEWLWRIRPNLFLPELVIPRWLDISLRLVKYVLLGFFLWITWNMSVRAITVFINTPYYKVSDVKMLHFFTRMSALTGIVLVILVIGSIFVKNFWCRYFCPYGALTGLVAILSPFRVRRDKDKCISCGACSKACPHRIDVMRTRSVANPECSACLDCVVVCPAEGALSFRLTKLRKLVVTPFSLGVGIVGLFSVVYVIAAWSGYWESSITELEFRQMLRILDHQVISHPSW